METTFKLDGSNLQVTVTKVDDGVIPGWHVDTHTFGLPVDRTQLLGFGLTAKHGKLALRLQAAILAGRVFGAGIVRVDVNGKRYISADSKVLGRTMNADLKRLGF